jgi:hypothetical protein
LINIPNSVTIIGDFAFYGCDSLTSINILGNVTDIGFRAFEDCKNLASVTLPDNITTIGGYAFVNCGSLTSINIPNSVTDIGDSAFAKCGSLTSINIPDTVTVIGGYAFANCESLTSVSIPDSVTTIGDSAFYGCKSLTAINIGSNNPNYSSEDGVLFNKNKTTLIHYPAEKTGSYAIPDSVTDINTWSLGGCRRLTAINIDSNNPNYSSEDGVLFDKNKTTLIHYPAEKTGPYAIPDSVTDIGVWAFANCKSLTSIIIPDSVINIVAWAFANCKSLARIHNKRATPQIIGSLNFIFEDVTKQTCTLYVPESAVAIYKSALGWGDFANIVGEI